MGIKFFIFVIDSSSVPTHHPSTTKALIWHWAVKTLPMIIF